MYGIHAAVCYILFDLMSNCKYVAAVVAVVVVVVAAVVLVMFILSMERDLSIAVANPEFEVDELLGCMKSFALEQLVGNSSLNDKGTVKDVLAWRDIDNEFLGDINWFADFFPKNLLMANFVEGYKYLQKINNR